VTAWWAVLDLKALEESKEKKDLELLGSIKEFHPSKAYTVIFGPQISYMAGIVEESKLVFCMMSRAEKGSYSDPTSVKERALSASKEFPDVVRTLVDLSPPDSIAETLLYDIERFPHWSSKSSRCFLIGDAAHAMTPFLGLGANSAMNDGFVLAKLLLLEQQLSKSDVLSPESLSAVASRYEARRKGSLEGIVDKAASTGKWLVPSSRFGNWILKAGLYLTPSSLVVNEISSGDAVNDVSDLM
jgi:2-polyprenyl-6-methoxyphenol hydroxylase-like FAD-dependent oxidoreductase